MKMSNVQIAYHRNGITGKGFHVVLFTWRDPDDKRPRPMMATVFEDTGAIAVLDVAETASSNIAFAQGNSWRGDEFEQELRAQIAVWSQLPRKASL